MNGDLAEHIKSVVKGIVDNDHEYLRASVIHLLSQDDISTLIAEDNSYSGSGSKAIEWVNFLLLKLKEEGKYKDLVSLFYDK
jgi:hypothetical protein